MIREKRDMALLVEVETCLRLVKYSPGRIEFEPTEAASPDLAARLAGRLQGWTGVRWGVSVTSGGGGTTLAERRATELGEKEDEALKNTLVAAVFQSFPSAKITEIRDLSDAESDAAAEALPEVEDVFDPDWDPFEET